MEKLCDGATIIRGGRTVETLDLEELRTLSDEALELEDLFMRHYETSADGTSTDDAGTCADETAGTAR